MYKIYNSDVKIQPNFVNIFSTICGLTGLDFIFLLTKKLCNIISNILLLINASTFVCRLFLPSDPMAEPGCEVVEDHLRSVFCDFAEILAEIFCDLHIAATTKHRLFLFGSSMQYNIFLNIYRYFADH